MKAGISPPMGRSMHILFCFRKPFDSLWAVLHIEGSEGEGERRGRRVETVLRKVYLAERTNGRRTDGNDNGRRVNYGERLKRGELGCRFV